MAFRGAAHLSTSTDSADFKSQNSRLVAQNKKLIRQLERMTQRIPQPRHFSGDLGDDDNSSSFIAASSSDEDFGNRRKNCVSDSVLPSFRAKKLRASKLSSVSEPPLDDLSFELEEEKRLRTMAENQRDDAMRSVEELRESLSKTRIKLKESSRRFLDENQKTNLEVDELKADNADLLTKLRESATQLEVLNAENQSLIEEHQLVESNIDGINLQEEICNLTRELEKRTKSLEELEKSLEGEKKLSSRLQMEKDELTDEIEHLKTLDGIARADAIQESFHSCGLHSLSSRFRQELSSSEIEIGLANSLHNDATDENSLELVGQVISEVNLMKQKSRDGEQKLIEMLKAIDALESERNELAAKLKAAENEKMDSSEGIKEVESKLRKREEQLQQLLKEVEVKGDEINDVCVDNEKKRKELEQMKNSLNGCKIDNDRLNDDLARIKLEAIEKDKRVASLEDTFAQSTFKWQGHIKSLNESVENLKLENQNMSHKLEVKTSECLSLQKNYSVCGEDLANKVAYYNNLIVEMRQKKDEVDGKLKTAHAQIETINEERRKMLEEIEELKQTWENKLVKQRSDIHKLTKLVKRYKAKEEQISKMFIEKEEEKEKMKEDLRLSNQKVEDFENAYARLEAQLTESETKFNELKDDSAQRESLSMDKLHNAEEEASRLTRENHRLKTRINEQETEKGTLALTNEQFQRKSEKDCSVITKKDQENARINKLLNEAKVVLGNQSGTISALEEKVVELDARLKEEKEKIVEKEKLLESKRNDNDNSNSTVISLQKKLVELGEELALKSSEFSNKTVECEKIRKQLQESEEEVTRLEGVVGDQKRQMLQRAAQVAQMDMAVKEHRSDTDVAVTKLETALNQSLEDLKAKVDEVELLGQELKEKEKHCKDLRDAVSRYEANSFVLKDRVHELERKFEEDRRLIDELRGEKSGMELKLGLLKDQLKEKQNQLMSNNQDLLVYQNNVSSLENQLSDAVKFQREASSVSAENQRLRMQISDLEAEKSREIRRLNATLDKNLLERERESNRVREAHDAAMADRDVVLNSLNQELDRCRASQAEAEEKAIEMQNLVGKMKQELHQRMDVVNEANEALVLKDCQIAKLEGRLASLERISKMTAPSFSGPDNNFLRLASSVGVTPLNNSPRRDWPSGGNGRTSPTNHMPSPVFSPPRISPTLMPSPPLPSSLQLDSAFLPRRSSPVDGVAKASKGAGESSHTPPHSTASDIDIKFKGVIQYLKENGKCDDELEEIGRDLKETLKRSLSPKNNSKPNSGDDPVGRSSLDSTFNSVVMTTQIESAEEQLKQLEAQLKANALKRMNVDSQINGLLSSKKK